MVSSYSWEAARARHWNRCFSRRVGLLLLKAPFVHCSGPSHTQLYFPVIALLRIEQMGYVMGYSWGLCA